MGDGLEVSKPLCFIPRKSTENFSRLCQLIMKICSDLFRDILSRYIKPSELRSELDKNKNKLMKIMNLQQKELIYSVACKTSLTAKDLDISLLYMILRNICNIPEHKNGWGKRPIKGDNSIAACIERIRFQRNLISAHSTNGEVEEAEFLNYWNELSDTVLEIEKQLIGGESYERAVNCLLTCDLNPDRAEKYQDEFKRLHERMERWERIIKKRGKKRKHHQSFNGKKIKGMEKRLKCLEDEHNRLKSQQKENLQNIDSEKNNVHCHENDDDFNDDDDNDDDDDDDDNYENGEDVDDEDDYDMEDTYDFYNDDDDDDNYDDADDDDGSGDGDDEDDNYDDDDDDDHDDDDHDADDDFEGDDSEDNYNDGNSDGIYEDTSDSDNTVIKDDLCYEEDYGESSNEDTDEY